MYSQKFNWKFEIKPKMKWTKTKCYFIQIYVACTILLNISSSIRNSWYLKLKINFILYCYTLCSIYVSISYTKTDIEKVARDAQSTNIFRFYADFLQVLMQALYKNLRGPKRGVIHSKLLLCNPCEGVLKSFWKFIEKYSGI